MKSWMRMLAVGLLALSACEQADEGVADGHVDVSEIVLCEVQSTDAIPVTLTQTFLYDGAARLVSYRMRQRYTAVETGELVGSAVLTYQDKQVVVKDGIGNEWVYTWNAEYDAAVSCMYRSTAGSRRRYQFSYASVGEKYYLSGLKEYLDDATEPFSTLTVDYTDVEYPVVTKQMYDYTQRFQLDCSSANCLPNRAQLPVHFYTELYPLSQHCVALYARLLGDVPDVFPRGVLTLDSPFQETCTYDYQLKNQLPVSCRINHSGLGLRTLSFQLEE